MASALASHQHLFMGELGPYVVGWLDFCHDAAPLSSLCGLDWLRWLDPVFGVISRCLCVCTCIPIDGETCGVGRLPRLVGLYGTRRMLRPTDATNATTTKQSTACGGPLPQFCCGITTPNAFAAVWRRVALRDEVREFVFGSALSASSAAGVRPEPSADSMLRMVAACLGSTAPSTRHIVNHLLFNS